ALIDERQDAKAFGIFRVVGRAQHPTSRLDEVHQIAVRIARLLDPIRLEHEMDAAAPVHRAAELVWHEMSELGRPMPPKGTAEQRDARAVKLKMPLHPFDDRQKLDLSILPRLER